MAKNKATAAQLDFTNVKDGGGSFNARHVPPGDYKAKVIKVEDAVKKDDKSKKMWLFTIEVDGAKYPYYCTFDESQLWKIRNLFVAAGINVAKKRTALDPNKVVGKFIAVTLEDDEYDGKMKSVVNATFPISELDGDIETGSDDDEEPDDDTPSEEDEPKKKKGKKKKGKKSELDELDIEDI